MVMVLTKAGQTVDLLHSINRYITITITITTGNGNGIDQSWPDWRSLLHSLNMYMSCCQLHAADKLN